MKFIDVSSHNGSINFSNVVDDGFEAVIIKATEGTTYQDDMRNEHYHGAKAAGLKVGFYHYLRKSSDPVTQADNFYNEICNKDIDIKPVLDVEDMNNNFAPGEAEDYCNRFLQRMNEHGYNDILIYSGRCFIEEHFSAEFCSDKYWWVAEYANSVKDVPKCGTWTAWQFAQYGRAKGVNGNCDLNYLLESNNFYLGKAINNTNNELEPVREANNVNIYSDLQERLNDAGFRDENGNTLIVDGKPGKLTLSACPTLSVGCKGSITEWVQLRVGCEPDGDYGKITADAITGYQYNKGITCDGICGQNTWRKLLNL